MKKTKRLELRLSEAEYAIIMQCSTLRQITASRFILSCVIPICCKIKAYEDEKRKKKNG